MVGEMRMFYDDLGDAQAPPVVMLHGFTGTGADQWPAQVDAFSRGYRLIIPDLRGHGRTDNPAGRPAMNLRRLAQDIAELCRLLGVARAAFCGESIGGMLLLTLALAHPDLVAAAVLSAVSDHHPEGVRAWQATQSVDSLAATWFGQPGALEAFAARHTALGRDHWRTVLADFLALSAHAHADDFPEADELAAITSPVLLVHGDRDWLFPVEIPVRLYRALPRGELCVLPATDHLPPVERPALFNEIALAFLARHYPTS